MTIQDLNKTLGNIDLYLLDQILKNNIALDAKILDAGCGEGRNLTYFLSHGYQVDGIDLNDEAIQMLKFIVGSKYPQYDKERFLVGQLDRLPYQNHSFDYVVCSAVLHFASDDEHFKAMLLELDRVLKASGTLFIRMASDIGLEGHKLINNGIYELPDGSQRFLLKQASADRIKAEMNYSEIEPIKTVVVNQMRSMTTLVLKKL